MRVSSRVASNGIMAQGVCAGLVVVRLHIKQYVVAQGLGTLLHVSSLSECGSMKSAVRNRKKHRNAPYARGRGGLVLSGGF